MKDNQCVMVTEQVEAFIIDHSHTTLQSVKLRYVSHDCKAAFLKSETLRNITITKITKRFVSNHSIDIITLYHPAVGCLTVCCNR